jgi:hypothetical protein
MKVLIPVIGIPNYPWKRKAVKYARRNPSIITLEVNGLCYECDRHRELLKMFDEGNMDYKNSSYFRDSGKLEVVILKKIENYRDMYFSMKNDGYKLPKENAPIITEDGCRLDGSHRLAILEHLDIKETNINVFSYADLFSKSELRKILKDNLAYRKEVYDL